MDPSEVAGPSGEQKETTNANVQVAVRVRPPSAREREQGFSHCVSVDAASNTIAISGKTSKRFCFDHVADETASQQDIFLAVGKPIADFCLQGYHCCLLAYGQTGAGKTFTMEGPDIGPDMTPAANGMRPGADPRGLVPRILDYMFECMEQEQRLSGVEFTVRCSYLQIYNDQVSDLLDPSAPPLIIREDLHRGTFVDKAVGELVRSPEQAAELRRRGAANREVAATAMNEESSRSHSVFTLKLESQRKDDSGIVQHRTSRLYLVDLAGSERQRFDGPTGQRLKEAGSINRSLSALGNVIKAVVDNGRHVPYRDSKLTFLLRDVLGGNAKCTLIAAISPAKGNVEESLSTLKFVERAKLMRNDAVVNEATMGNPAVMGEEIRRLRLEIASLRGAGTREEEGGQRAERDTAEAARRTQEEQQQQRWETKEKHHLEKAAQLEEQARRAQEEAEALKRQLKVRAEEALAAEQSRQEHSEAARMAEERVKELQAQVDALQQEMGAAREERARTEALLKADLEEKARAEAKAREELESKVAECRALETSLAEIQELLTQSTKASREAAATAAAEATERCAAAEAQVAALQLRASEAEAATARAEEKAVAAEGALAEAVRRSEDEGILCARQEYEMEGLGARIRDAQLELAEAEAVAHKRAAELDHMQRAQAASEAEAAAARAEVAAARQEQAEFQGVLQVINQQMEQMEQMKAQLVAQLGELQEAKDRGAKQEARLKEAEAQLRAALEARRSAEAAAQAARAETQRLGEDLQSAEAAHSTMQVELLTQLEKEHAAHESVCAQLGPLQARLEELETELAARRLEGHADAEGASEVEAQWAAAQVVHEQQRSALLAQVEELQGRLNRGEEERQRAERDREDAARRAQEEQQQRWDAREKMHLEKAEQQEEQLRRAQEEVEALKRQIKGNAEEVTGGQGWAGQEQGEEEENKWEGNDDRDVGDGKVEEDEDEGEEGNGASHGRASDELKKGRARLSMNESEPRKVPRTLWDMASAAAHALKAVGAPREQPQMASAGRHNRSLWPKGHHSLGPAAQPRSPLRLLTNQAELPSTTCAGTASSDKTSRQGPGEGMLLQAHLAGAQQSGACAGVAQGYQQQQQHRQERQPYPQHLVSFSQHRDFNPPQRRDPSHLRELQRLKTGQPKDKYVHVYGSPKHRLYWEFTVNKQAYTFTGANFESKLRCYVDVQAFLAVADPGNKHLKELREVQPYIKERLERCQIGVEELKAAFVKGGDRYDTRREGVKKMWKKLTDDLWEASD